MTKENLQLANSISKKIEAIELTLDETESNFHISFSRNGSKIPSFLIDDKMIECATDIIKMGLIKNLEIFKNDFQSI